MKGKYEVDLYFTSSVSYIITAENADEALEIARDRIVELTRDTNNPVLRNLDEDESATQVTEL